MNCVKCGREIGEDQVFCEVCLAEMEEYPVKPGTAIHIPSRTPEEPTRKNNKRKVTLPLSEQIMRLKKKVLRLRILAAVLLLICGGLCLVVARTFEELDFQRLMGQNYHTAGETTPTEPTEPLVETIVP